MEDSDIIDLYWRRDQQAIGETAGKYGGFLWGIAWNILRSHGDAEECVNDTYLRTWNAIPPSRPTAFRAWLGRIARNLSLDRWKQGRAQCRGGGDAMEILLGELDGCVPAPHRVDTALEDREIAALISAFLRRLPQESRIMFLRRYWYGDTLADIAGHLGCGEGKVKSSLFRTRKALRAYLEQEGVFV
ncbi:RNA polymerase sigma factor [uncultured Oscillibacter sp.]|uniref:RNA polymerase sigma factor n=1 Tax=uncultured Oscillibacter sp. TaxID=876091 RepID=UPI0025CD0D05|nr:RNA polymerase sigma factor [uncultured Oscillibacter sp.]